jgi:hypothetical protein
VKKLLYYLLLLGFILSKPNTLCKRKKKLLSTNSSVFASKVVCLRSMLVISFNIILKKLVNWKNWIVLKKRIKEKPICKNIRNLLKYLWLLYLTIFLILVLVSWGFYLLICPSSLCQLLNNFNLILYLEIVQ